MDKKSLKYNDRILLLDFETVKKKCRLNNFSQKTLLERSILPLYATPLLANFCGHLIGDGGLKLLNNDQGAAVRFYGTKKSC